MDPERLQRLIQEHGGVISSALKVPKIKDERVTFDAQGKPRPVNEQTFGWEIDNPDPEAEIVFVFNDGKKMTARAKRDTGGEEITRWEVTDPGDAIRPAAADTTWSSVEWVPQPDGTQKMYGFDPGDQIFKPVPNAPSKPATDKDKPAPVREKVNGVTYERQPDGTYAPARGLPIETQTVPKPTAPTVTQGGDKRYYQYDFDKKQWTLAPGMGQGEAAAEGATRKFIDQRGYEIGQKVQNGQWVIDPDVPEQPWSAQAKADVAKLGNIPTEGKTKRAVEGGYDVTKTYQGGEWDVTDVGKRVTPLTPANISAPADQPFITRTDENGQIVREPNPNYQPKTPGQIAARTSQLYQVMQAKGAEITKQFEGDSEKGLQAWNAWYDQSIKPEMDALQAAQEENIFARGKDIAEMQRQALQQAVAAGNQQITGYQAAGLSRVGPGAAEMLNRAGQRSEAFRGIDNAPAFMEGRDPRELAAEATARALKDISPMAAQMAGGPQPNYGMMNPAEVLNRTMWKPGAAAPVAAAAPAAAPATPGQWPPGATTPIIVNEAGEQQWGYPMQTGAAPALDTTGFGGAIGNDPMAAAMQSQAAPQFMEAALPQAAPTGAPSAIAPMPMRRQVAAPAPAATAALPAPTGEAYYPTEVGGPVYQPPPYAPSVSALGEPMYPTEVGGPMQYGTPGFGFDPSNIQVAPAVAAPVEYAAPQYQFPGMQGIYDAARAAYGAMPRTRWR